MIALLPATCTFLLYFAISLYYLNVSLPLSLYCFRVQFYLLPTINMDYTHVSFKQVWEDEAAAHRQAEAAKWHLGLFVVFALNLFVSILRTISTPPGGIPEDKEWDFADTSCTSTD
jgi:hypothetical protein